MNSFAPIALHALAGLITALLASCSSSGPTGSGFLSDYSKLQPNEGQLADLIYISPEADFSKYDSVLIDPVSLRGENAAALPQGERDNLATLLRQSFIDEMGPRFKLVSEAGPSTLRLRLALSDIQAAKRALNTPTTIVPVGRLISETQRLTTGTQNFAGSAVLEAEVTDSTSGEQLAAGIDRQFGKKRIKTAASKWGEVEKIFDLWAKEITATLVLRRGA